MVCSLSKVVKQLFKPSTNIRLTTFWFCIIFFPSALTLLLILSGIFLFVDVTASVFSLGWSSFSIWHIFDVLSAKSKSFFYFFMVLMSSFNWFWKLLLTFRNLILLTKFHNSHSNEIISLIFRGQLHIFKPYVCCILSPLRLM